MYRVPEKRFSRDRMALELVIAAVLPPIRARGSRSCSRPSMRAQSLLPVPRPPTLLRGAPVSSQAFALICTGRGRWLPGLLHNLDVLHQGVPQMQSGGIAHLLPLPNTEPASCGGIRRAKPLLPLGDRPSCGEIRHLPAALRRDAPGSQAESPVSPAKGADHEQHDRTPLKADRWAGQDHPRLARPLPRLASRGQGA